MAETFDFILQLVFLLGFSIVLIVGTIFRFTLAKRDDYLELRKINQENRKLEFKYWIDKRALRHNFYLKLLKKNPKEKK